MKVYENKKYIEDVIYVAGLNLPWDKLKNKSILLSGATGLVGSFFVDVIMKRNEYGMNCKVYALGRNETRAKERFLYCADSPFYEFVPYDITKTFVRNDIGTVDYVLHLASNTHPMQYSTDPIGTITTNIFGTYNMLEFAKMHKTVRSAFVSSNEIYGENRGDVELFDEQYCGYIDCNTLRAGYPESKRCSEALCQAYIKQNNMDIVIPRPTRSYGPTMLMTDTKAISQFIKKAVNGDDIVLKSIGTQYYSYTYVADTVSGILTVLLCGNCGEAYNIADKSSDVMLKDLAQIIAELSGKKVIFEVPDVVEAIGYSKATKARLDGSKLKTLGWMPKYDIKTGLNRTLDILNCIK
ncbi:MAG: NAD-dependent epimerase/dehydratase family protein [Clostridia bacterium]|nr:NAD-dependent epimerase/dehydratase family protein [Clostridia bacterium]